MAREQSKNPGSSAPVQVGDHTGRLLQAQAKEVEQQKQEAAARMTMATAQQKFEDDHGVVDLTPEGIAAQREAQRTVDPEPQIAGEATREIRMGADLENICIGVGTNYNFVQGKRYRVPAHIADHLDGLGYTV